MKPSEDPDSAAEITADSPLASASAFDVVKDIEDRLKASLPLQQQSKVSRVVREVIEQRVDLFAGPLPPPELLSQYDQAHQGAAAQILHMALAEQQHRHRCDLRSMAQQDEQIRLEHRDATYTMAGLVLGFVAFLLIAGVGVYSLVLGKDWFAGTCFTSFAIGEVALFIKGRGRPAASRLDERSDRDGVEANTTESH